MKNNIYVSIKALLFSTFILSLGVRGSAFDSQFSNTIDSCSEKIVLQKEEINGGDVLCKQIIKDAQNEFKKKGDFSLSNVIRTVNISVAYHQNLEELSNLYMPLDEESWLTYRQRNMPDKKKREIVQVIKQLDKDSILHNERTKKAKRRTKKESSREYSCLEFDVLKHIYNVWNESHDSDTTKAVIKTYLDLPYLTLKRSYEYAQKNGLLRDYLKNGFSNGCIALKTNTLEQWLLSHH